MQLQPIFDDCALRITRYEEVHGGDINRSYCLFTADKKYFLKVNDASSFPNMLQKEAEGLHALKSTHTVTIPTVINQGTTGNTQYLLLEWIEKQTVSKDRAEDLGKNLARMHKLKQFYYGWENDNYIGSLPQSNNKSDTWDEFYTECRIMPLVQQLFDKGIFTITEIKAAGKLCNKLDQVFPAEHPSLLHGDLWNGNYLISTDGKACLFDPAVYYGHREMDIGMSKLFGGFDKFFYEAYEEIYPLEPGWEKRLPVTQAWPLLVHSVLFGGQYINRAREILHHFS